MELCDPVDNDCNGLTDDDDPNVIDQIQWCADSDEDGFGTSDITQTQCDMPNGFVLDCTDCDDTNSAFGANCEILIYQNGFEDIIL